MRKELRADYLRETQRAARQLGIPTYGPDADAAIVAYCQDQVSLWVKAHGVPSTTTELLDLVAVSLGVEFVEIHSDAEMDALLERFPPTREPVMATVRTALDDETDALTLRRNARAPWERPYLAVINCRGWHFHRRFFSKWHELAHRLIEGEQLKFAFRQTVIDRKDPEEILVDKIAGALAFFPGVVGPCVQEELSASGFTFSAVERVRARVAPDASRQATIMALLAEVPGPAWYLRCRISLSLTEARATGVTRKSFQPKLRVQDVSANDRATSSGIRIHQWMRVPDRSLVAVAHASNLDRRGVELLDLWETSAGGPIGQGPVFLDVSARADEVWVLVSVAA